MNSQLWDVLKNIIYHLCSHFPNLILILVYNYTNIEIKISNIGILFC